MAFTHALVRPPGDSFAAAISSTNAAIDVALARAQHVEYCQALVRGRSDGGDAASRRALPR